MSYRWLNDNDFRLVSSLVLAVDGRMRLLHWSKIEDAVAPLTSPSLYVFLETDADMVLYVGKAGKGWSARRPQHNGGYERARRGLTSPAHQQRIAELRAYLGRGGSVAIFERAVASPDVIDTEEEHLITALKPVFNVRRSERQPLG